MLRPQDVGFRVVVRRVAEIRAGRTLYSDALGELVELTETDLTLHTQTGPLRIPLTSVHRAKRIPPSRRPTAAAVADVELAANEAWPAPVQQRLGDWLLRAAGGWTGRANSALAVGDPGHPLSAAIDEVERWYAARRQPAMVNVPLPLARPVNDALDDRGWDTLAPVLVQTAPVSAILAATSGDGTDPADGWPDPLPPVELATTASPGWLALVAGRKQGLPDAARHVLTAVDQIRFAHLYAPTGRSGTPELIGIARGAVTGSGRWLGLSLIEVVPAARRRGVARHLVRALAEWAHPLGATDAYLQVVRENVAATTLYRRLGFRTHHTYLTRVAPGVERRGAPVTPSC